MIIMLVFLFILVYRELEDVREHDRRVTEEAETAQRDVRIIYIFYNLRKYFSFSFEQL